ncbi:MAG: anthranilate synthase component I family protein [Bdellovibrionales bacterium]|nr:anthranilate synthase component I family protein [Bdellovibrionales bacterium]
MISRIESEILDIPNRSDFIHGLLAEYSEHPGFMLTEGNWWNDGFTTYIFLEPHNVFLGTADGDIWSELQQFLDTNLINSLSANSHEFLPPTIAGYFGYELLHHIEKIPYAAGDKLNLPVINLYAYNLIFEIPQDQNRPARSHRVSYADSFQPLWQFTDHFSKTASEINSCKIDIDLAQLANALEPCSNFSREDYKGAINYIREEIAAGQVYQVNLTQQFRLPFSHSARRYYNWLRTISPANRACLFSSLKVSGKFSIVSASPECFVIRRSNELLTSPIKGTRRRSSDIELDEALRKELACSPKDRAELAMIVDLMRNDLGRIAEFGSVKVLDHAKLCSLAQVHHLHSDISCHLRSEVSLPQIIRALFPCGSITGAPKIAATRYISALEQTARGVYTGAIGMITPSGDISLSVAIRTSVICDDSLIFGSGGGIVYDSDPELEYQESLSKAKGQYLAYCALRNSSVN